MADISANNKRIAKNTMLLYVRMLFIMIVSLFTSRVVLNTLGVEDYGIYNVVGGVVAIMGLINSSMGSATSRYLTFELGRGNKEALRKTFITCFEIYVILGLLFVLIAETIGLWFLNTQLTIPLERMRAANWVYQFSIFSVVNHLLVNPYNASIIAHERMGVYAYVSIIEALLKLLVAYAIIILPYDRLSSYGFLYLIMSLTVTMIYRIYCVRNFEECRLEYCYDRTLMRRIFSFSGWTLFGATAVMVKGQGLNILLNMFFNPAVNASRGIAYQVNTNLVRFGDNFYTAVRPQITKYYAQGDTQNMLKLVFRSSKFIYYLLLCLALPILIETPAIINLWLGQTPEYVVEFARLIIIISIIDSLAHPIMTSINATGRIAMYQFLMGFITILNLPISFYLLKHGGNPMTVFEVSIILTSLCYCVRIFLLKRQLPEFPVCQFLRKIIFVILLTTLFSAAIPIILNCILEDNIINCIIICSISLICTLTSIFCIGLNKEERAFIINSILKRMRR
jgi:O-antigen/teichoic acid export membrane protein